MEWGAKEYRRRRKKSLTSRAPLRTPQPSPLAARIYFLGFLVARVLHSVFYIGEMQPHRTIAFAIGSVLMVAMAVTTLVALV